MGLTKLSSTGSRDSGDKDIAQGFVYLTIKPLRWLAGQLFDSGKKAHDAANELDNLNAKTEANNGSMQALGGSSAVAAGGTGSGQSAAPGTNGTTGASSPHSEHAEQVYGEFEKATGMGRDEFLNASRRFKGDPEAIGEFMHEQTGNAAFGRDSVKSAMELFASDPSGAGQPRSYAGYGIKEFAVSEATASAGPTGGNAMPSIPVPSAGNAAEVTQKVTALAIPQKDDLRNKLKKALAEKGSVTGDSLFGKETLEPLREDGIFRDPASTDAEMSLFDVVHSKYSTLTKRMSPTLRISP